MIARTYLFLCITAAWSLTAVAARVSRKAGKRPRSPTTRRETTRTSAPTKGSGPQGFHLAVSRLRPDAQPAQILVENGSRVLRLLSNRSFTNCTDDIWVMLAEFESFNQDFGVPLTPEARRSPSTNAASWKIRSCTTEASTASIPLLRQHLPGPDRQPRQHPGLRHAAISGGRREHPEHQLRRHVSRDLPGPDGRQLPAKSLRGLQQRSERSIRPSAQIQAIEFRVDEHGWGIIDNIIIDRGTRRECARPSILVACHDGPFLHRRAKRNAQKLLTSSRTPGSTKGSPFGPCPRTTTRTPCPYIGSGRLSRAGAFLTIDQAERDKLLGGVLGRLDPEGVAFHAYAEGSQPVDSVPVYRFWSPVAELPFLHRRRDRTRQADQGLPVVWTFEGIAWYAFRP